jgi:hypothetical protein
MILRIYATSDPLFFPAKINKQPFACLGEYNRRCRNPVACDFQLCQAIARRATAGRRELIPFRESGAYAPGCRLLKTAKRTYQLKDNFLLG